MTAPECDRCRGDISAALDGEATASQHAAVEAHLRGCPGCRGWCDDAARVTRLARIGPAEAGPDLADAVLAATARTRRARRRRAAAARVGLAVVGVLQVLLGVAALLDAVDAHGGGATMMLGAGMAHMGHETAAWNMAVGAAFLAGAWWTRHLAGLLPVLGAFIAVLAALSAVDLLAGRVDPGRVAAHLLLVAGFVLSLLVSRRARGTGPGTPGRMRHGRRRTDSFSGTVAAVERSAAPGFTDVTAGRSGWGEDPVARHGERRENGDRESA